MRKSLVKTYNPDCECDGTPTMREVRNNTGCWVDSADFEEERRARLDLEKAMIALLNDIRPRYYCSKKHRDIGWRGMKMPLVIGAKTMPSDAPLKAAILAAKRSIARS